MNKPVKWLKYNPSAPLTFPYLLIIPEHEKNDTLITACDRKLTFF